MTARYAIYYAPAANSGLWRRASAWLGRDAVTGETLPQPHLPELDGVDIPAITVDPRHYGFHATLKAPFELAEGRTEAELLDAARAFAAGRPVFTAGVAPNALGRFLAFRLTDGEAVMEELHAACVRDFEPFRAPLSDADIARRRKARLTPGQDARMLAWGYPYIFDEFRFHMTLTGAIADDALRGRVLEVLRSLFQADTGPHRFDAVAVFRQPDRQSMFEVLARLPFGA